MNGKPEVYERWREERIRRRKNGRWQIACINWGHEVAPHAMTYLLVDDSAECTAYHETFGDAIRWLERFHARTSMTTAELVNLIRARHELESQQ